MTDTTAPVPAPRVIAVRNVFADPCTHCHVPAGVICDEPYCPGSMGVEFIGAENGHLDALLCTPDCGNRCDLTGFYPVLADGTFDAALCGPQWVADGELVGCGDCGRVFSQLARLADRELLQVLFTAAAPPFAP